MSNVTYTTRTGDEPRTADDAVVIEHARPLNLRVTDPRYGLKTAARLAREKKTRDEFGAARTAALVKQRASIEARLTSLRKDVRQITEAVTSGKVKGNARIEDAIAKVERLGAAEARMVSDIVRLNSKIGA